MKTNSYVLNCVELLKTHSYWTSVVLVILEMPQAWYWHFLIIWLTVQFIHYRPSVSYSYLVAAITGVNSTVFVVIFVVIIPVVVVIAVRSLLHAAVMLAGGEGVNDRGGGIGCRGFVNRPIISRSAGVFVPIIFITLAVEEVPPKLLPPTPTYVICFYVNHMHYGMVKMRRSTQLTTNIMPADTLRHPPPPLLLPRPRLPLLPLFAQPLGQCGRDYCWTFSSHLLSYHTPVYYTRGIISQYLLSWRNEPAQHFFLQSWYSETNSEILWVCIYTWLYWHTLVPMSMSTKPGCKQSK